MEEGSANSFVSSGRSSSSSNRKKKKNSHGKGVGKSARPQSCHCKARQWQTRMSFPRKIQTAHQPANETGKKQGKQGLWVKDWDKDGHTGCKRRVDWFLPMKKCPVGRFSEVHSQCLKWCLHCLCEGQTGCIKEAIDHQVCFCASKCNCQCFQAQQNLRRSHPQTEEEGQAQPTNSTTPKPIRRKEGVFSGQHSHFNLDTWFHTMWKELSFDLGFGQETHLEPMTSHWHPHPHWDLVS